MQSYLFNIVEYRTETIHLTLIEHYIYRELIDWYYLDEKPIPPSIEVIKRRLRLNSTTSYSTHAVEKAINAVLRDFFTETPYGWVNARCEQELEKHRVNPVNTKRQRLVNAVLMNRQRTVNDSSTNRHQH